MTIRMSSLGGGGGAAVKLAPDLLAPSTTITKTVNVDPSSGLTTLLSLTGKWLISSLVLNGLASENYTIRLTVDSQIIWDDTVTSTGARMPLYGDSGLTSGWTNEPAFICNSSLLLEIESTSDTSVDFSYIARPIL